MIINMFKTADCMVSIGVFFSIRSSRDIIITITVIIMYVKDLIFKNAHPHTIGDNKNRQLT